MIRLVAIVAPAALSGCSVIDRDLDPPSPDEISGPAAACDVAGAPPCRRQHADSEAAARGDLWIPVATDARGNEYSMLQRDLRNATDLSPRIWIEGNHARDRNVGYARSQTLWELDCRRRTYRKVAEVYYRADGSVRKSARGVHATGDAAPGTVAEAWLRRACPPGSI